MEESKVWEATPYSLVEVESRLPYFSTLKMEEERYSETSGELRPDYAALRPRKRFDFVDVNEST
jgi:hypothetical protein